MTPRREITTASNATAAQFLWRRVRCSQIQKTARIRFAAGEPVDWRAWAETLTNERLWLRAGVYQNENWVRHQSWPSANAATALCYGRNAPFARPENVPPDIRAAVETGVAAALARGHQLPTATKIAERLDVTAAFRREHRIWMIGALDKSRDELRAEARALASERARARRAADRQRKANERRASGKMTREEYLAAAAQRRAAIAASGISERSFYRMQKKTFDNVASGCNAFGESCSAETDIYNCGSEGLLPKRYTLAAKARELGIEPAALRVRLYRERQRATSLDASPTIQKNEALPAPARHCFGR